MPSAHSKTQMTNNRTNHEGRPPTVLKNKNRAVTYILTLLSSPAEANMAGLVGCQATEFTTRESSNQSANLKHIAPPKVLLMTNSLCVRPLYRCKTSPVSESRSTRRPSFILTRSDLPSWLRVAQACLEIVDDDAVVVAYSDKAGSIGTDWSDSWSPGSGCDWMASSLACEQARMLLLIQAADGHPRGGVVDDDSVVFGSRGQHGAVVCVEGIGRVRRRGRAAAMEAGWCCDIDTGRCAVAEHGQGGRRGGVRGS
ncbi:hypothetical protein KCU73_g148, partial [Aureobasidium melanogenum]